MSDDLHARARLRYELTDRDLMALVRDLDEAVRERDRQLEAVSELVEAVGDVLADAERGDLVLSVRLSSVVRLHNADVGYQASVASTPTRRTAP